MKPQATFRFALIVFAVSFAASLPAASVIQFTGVRFTGVENAQMKPSATK